LVDGAQFGGRQRSSCIDAMLTLEQDIKARQQEGHNVFSVLCIDVKGYFNNVNHDRMGRMMELLSFSPNTVGWTKSFLEDRKAKININGFTSVAFDLAGVGIPQGSPILPILSTIYSALIIPRLRKLAETRGWSDFQAYVDDGMIKVWGPDASTNALRLAQCFAVLRPLYENIGLSIDIDKLECMHFVRPLRPGSPPLDKVKLVFHGGREVMVTPSTLLRYLGFWLTPKLKWDKHVKRMAMRGRSTVTGLCILANTVRGMNVANARLLYLSVVRPVLTYGCQVWYTGLRQQGLVDILDKAQAEALRWVLGLFRTSPKDTTEHLASIPPMKFYLDKLRHNTATRFSRLPDSHPVALRLPASWPTFNPNLANDKASSRINSIAASSDPETERTEPFQERWLREWEDSTRNGELDCSCVPPYGSSKGENEEFHNKTKGILSWGDGRKDLQVWTNGSRRLITPFKRTGAGAIINHYDNAPITLKWGLGAYTTVFDAKMHALASSAHFLFSLFFPSKKIKILNKDPATIPALKIYTPKAPLWISSSSCIWFISDSLSTLHAITDTHDHPGQFYSLLFVNFCKKWLQDRPDRKIKLAWVKGHSRTALNDKVDLVAKEACALRTEPGLGPSITWRKEFATKQVT
jgi:hypothetical protein